MVKKPGFLDPMSEQMTGSQSVKEIVRAIYNHINNTSYHSHILNYKPTNNWRKQRILDYIIFLFPILYSLTSSMKSFHFMKGGKNIQLMKWLLHMGIKF